MLYPFNASPAKRLLITIVGRLVNVKVRKMGQLFSRSLASSCLPVYLLLAFLCLNQIPAWAADKTFQNCERSQGTVTCLTTLNQESVSIESDAGIHLTIRSKQNPKSPLVTVFSPGLEELSANQVPRIEIAGGTSSSIDKNSVGPVSASVSLVGNYVIKIEHNPSGYTPRRATYVYLPLGYVLTADQGSDYVLIDPNGPNLFTPTDISSFSSENSNLLPLLKIFQGAGADVRALRSHNYLFSDGSSVSPAATSSILAGAISAPSVSSSEPSAQHKIDCSAPPCCCHDPNTGRSCAADKSDQLATIIIRIHGIYGFKSDDKAGVWDEFYKRTQETRCVKVVDFEYKVDECLGQIERRLYNLIKELCKNHCCKILVLGYCAGGVVASKLAVNHNNSPTTYCSTSNLEIHTISAPTAGFGAPSGLPWLGCFQNEIGEGPSVGGLPDMGSSVVAKGVSFTAHVDPSDSVNGGNASWTHANTQDPNDPSGANPQVTHTWGEHRKAVEKVLQDTPELIPYCPCTITPAPSSLSLTTGQTVLSDIGLAGNLQVTAQKLTQSEASGERYNDSKSEHRER